MMNKIVFEFSELKKNSPKDYVNRWATANFNHVK